MREPSKETLDLPKLHQQVNDDFQTSVPSIYVAWQCFAGCSVSIGLGVGLRGSHVPDFGWVNRIRGMKSNDCDIRP